MKDGVWYVVSGKDKKPQLDENQILHWENLNDKVFSLIGLGLGDEVIHHLDFDYFGCHCFVLYLHFSLSISFPFHAMCLHVVSQPLS